MNRKRFLSTSTVFHLPAPDYTADWLAENVRLTNELAQAKQRIIDLETDLKQRQTISWNVGYMQGRQTVEEVRDFINRIHIPSLTPADALQACKTLKALVEAL